MGINEIIMYIMMFFMLIAAVDRILSQFGGSARFLGKLGKSIEGSGGQFEEGFMAMGALGLAMVGMTALAPVLAHLLGPVIIPLYEMLGANPSMFAGTLLACDMGGFFLAKELAGGDVAAWMYSGLILGSMMGPTIVFSIPVALGIIEPTDRRWLALGVLAGIVTIPIGCIAGGLVAMYSGVEINGQPVEFTFALILMNMIPVIIVAVLVGAGAEVYSGKNDQRLPDLRQIPRGADHHRPGGGGDQVPARLGADPRARSDLYGAWRPARRSDARHRSHWLYLLRAARRLSDGAPADTLV
ncbi:ethanolamine permease [Klebsiella pneumoniae]|nr:ethanolamine permease [Klebsiella pneumoniae]